MKRAVFFDRDGTLNVEREYLCDPDKLEIFPGGAAALQRLRDAGFVLFIVTNQSGIGRGFYTEEAMHAVNERLCEHFAREGVRFERIYFSPEHPNEPSRGRKPSPQFLLDARDEFGVDLGQSYMVGDKLIDVLCGRNAGVRRSLLVRTGYGAGVAEESAAELKDAWVVNDLEAAVDAILADAKR